MFDRRGANHHIADIQGLGKPPGDPDTEQTLGVGAVVDEVLCMYGKLSFAMTTVGYNHVERRDGRAF